MDPGWFNTPQQSVVVWQRSPMRWQPDSGWQTPIPDAGAGAHERLQQFAPVHVPLGEQISPAGRHPPGAPPAAAQIPTAAPAALLHRPPQHCASLEQMSPVTVQNDGFAQTPLLHQPDAQLAFVEHGLPSVGLPVGLSVLQALPPPVAFGTQFWLQQSPPAVHALPSATQVLVPHVFAVVQVPVQHSFPVAHVAPGSLQRTTGSSHDFVVPLSTQFAVQQSALVAHVEPLAMHGWPPAPASGLLTEPEVEPDEEPEDEPDDEPEEPPDEVLEELEEELDDDDDEPEEELAEPTPPSPPSASAVGMSSLSLPHPAKTSTTVVVAISANANQASFLIELLRSRRRSPRATTFRQMKHRRRPTWPAIRPSAAKRSEGSPHTAEDDEVLITRRDLNLAERREVSAGSRRRRAGFFVAHQSE
jgi:hypothetical protein